MLPNSVTTLVPLLHVTFCQYISISVAEILQGLEFLSCQQIVVREVFRTIFFNLILKVDLILAFLLQLTTYEKQQCENIFCKRLSTLGVFADWPSEWHFEGWYALACAWNVAKPWIFIEIGYLVICIYGMGNIYQRTTTIFGIYLLER